MGWAADDVGGSGDVARRALRDVLSELPSGTRGDAFLERIRRVSHGRDAHGPTSMTWRHGRGAALHCWNEEESLFAAADGAARPALATCVTGLAPTTAFDACASPPADTAGEIEGAVDPTGTGGTLDEPAPRFLAWLYAALDRQLAGVALSLELETIDRAMLVADDDGRVQATSWRWSRLRVGVRADSDAAAVWLGGAATVDALARTHPPAALAIILDRRLRGALTPRAGLPVCTPQTSVLFTAGNGGLVLHEFAHQLEGDLVSRGWSRWGDALQSPPRLSEKLTLWDDPNRVGLRGFYPVDDEGRPGERRLLVRRGRVAGYLGDRRRGTGTPRMRPGHGRRASWREPPAPRAANLCLAAGDADAGAVRDERGRVLVVHDLEGGGTDPRSGEMTVRVNDGEWVEDGRLIAPVAGLDLEGNVLDLLGAVDRLCSDRRPDGGAATCRRQGSGVPIGFLTPSFRTRGLAAFGRLPASRETL